MGENGGGPTGRTRRLRVAADRRTGKERRIALRSLFHDLRHPVGTINAIASELMLDPSLDSEVRNRLAMIAEEADHMAGLSAHLLDRRATRGLCDLQVVVLDVAGVRGAAYGDIVAVRSTPAWVAVDPVDAWRVVTNLVDNACRAAGPSGTVTIAVERPSHSGEVQLRVEDSGPGPGRGPKGRGGIGLRVVKEIVIAHGGSLRTEGRQEGGTRVLVTLPELGRPKEQRIRDRVG